MKKVDPIAIAALLPKRALQKSSISSCPYNIREYEDPTFVCELLLFNVVIPYQLNEYNGQTLCTYFHRQYVWMEEHVAP